MIKNALKAYGPHKPLYNRCVRWSRPCVFQRIFDVLAHHDRRHARKSAPHCRVCKAKRGESCIVRAAGGLHSRLHAVCDGNGRVRYA